MISAMYRAIRCWERLAIEVTMAILNTHQHMRVLGNTIKSFRLKKAATIPQAAKTTNISPRFWLSMENGQSSPGLSTIVKLIQYLGITPNCLLNELIHLDVS